MLTFGFSLIYEAFREAADSHVVYGVVEFRIVPPARFNGLINKRLKPKAGKDVETPFPFATDLYHALKSVAMAASDAERLRKQPEKSKCQYYLVADQQYSF